MDSKINSFEDACQSEGLDSTKLPDIWMLPAEHQDFIVNTYKLSVITQAKNREANNGEPWKANLSNSAQSKYAIYIYKNKDEPSGFGLSYLDCGLWLSPSFVPGRLCFKNPASAKDAIKQFPELYREYFLNAVK